MLLFINIIYIYMMCIYIHTYMDMYIFSHWFFNVSPLLASIFNRLLLKFSGPVWTLIASLKGSDTAAWLHSATCWTSRGTRPPSIEGDDDSNIFNRQIGTQPLPCARQWAGPRDIFKWQLHTLQGSASQVYLNSVQFSRSVVSDSLRPHESQHARPSCPSPTPRVYSNSHHGVGDAIQPSHPLSSPSPPAPNPSQHQGLFQRVNSSHEVAKVLGVSALASVLPMNTQD